MKAGTNGASVVETKSETPLKTLLMTEGLSLPKALKGCLGLEGPGCTEGGVDTGTNPNSKSEGVSSPL